MNKTPRRTLYILGKTFACSALALLFAQDANAQGARPLPPPPMRSLAAACRDDQLSVRNVGQDAAMGGVRRTDYAFTNTSPSPCSLRGHPRFEVLNRSGRVVRLAQATKGGYPGDPDDAVTIGPGKTATFYVSYNAGGAGRVGKPCPAYPKVRITAPGTKRGFVLREALRLCGGLEVSPVAEQP